MHISRYFLPRCFGGCCSISNCHVLPLFGDLQLPLPMYDTNARLIWIIPPFEPGANQHACSLHCTLYIHVAF
jgi:hypothetical protein